MKKFDNVLHMLIFNPDGQDGEVQARVNEDGIWIQKYNADKVTDDMIIDFLNETKQFKKFISKHPNVSIVESLSKNVPAQFLFGR